MYTNSTKDIPHNKEAESSTRESREIFSRLSCFYRLSEQQIPRPAVDKERRKMSILQVRRNDIILRIRLWLTIVVISFIKQIIKKERDMTIYSIYKKNHPVISKQVVKVIDLGFLGVEKDFLEQLSSHYHIKKIETYKSLSKKKKSIIKFI